MIQASWQEYVEAGRLALQRRDDAQWVLGDLACEVAKDYGKNALGKYASDVRQPYKTLKEYRRVSAAYEKAKRLAFSDLSWSFFLIAAAEDTRFEWLQSAQDNGWSCERLRAEIRASKQRNLAEVPPPEGRYRCLVIDPPWPIKKIEREVRPKQWKPLDYPTMSLEQIAELPICDLADPAGCHIYLWVTHRFLPSGLALFKQWGANYQCLMTWVKPVGFTPYSWMYNTEHVLFGRIGSLDLLRSGMKLSFEAPVTKHSAKPDVFFERVCDASPPPRLNMFARQEREGFLSWGNEV